MTTKNDMQTPDEEPRKGLNIFEKSLTVWVLLCIAGGIALGMAAPGVAGPLDSALDYRIL
jgi:ACR3 family arsenite transporter